MILFLTSSPMGAYRSEKAPDFKGLNPENGMVDELRHYWKERSRCLLISAFPDEYEVNDRMREDFYRIFLETGLSVECMDLCDGRNGEEAVSELRGYDMVILGGGHVPTETEFFDRIGLRRALKSWDGIVMGISAGSMNCAETVYAQPEMPGEATDPEYPRFIQGLGLTDVNILPHYQAVKDDLVDGMRLMEDITIPDSFGHAFYAITDGSYLLQTPERKEIRGEAYRIAEGQMEKISETGGRFELPRPLGSKSGEEAKNGARPQRSEKSGIDTAAVYGLGALGMLFGSMLQKEYGPENIKFVMDDPRYARHKNDRYTINGEEFDFAITATSGVEKPSDLVIVAVKGAALAEVVEQIAPSVGPDTIIISFMNGISSEDILARKYGRDRILDCIAIGMDAMREGTALNYTQMGKLQFGSRTGTQDEEVGKVERFLAEAGVPHEVREDIRWAMWRKFLLNVGVNQACTVYETDYGHVTAEGPICDEMREAMREVCRVAAAEGIVLGEEDIEACIELEKTLKPDGYPSMRQDALAGRKTEVDLFAGTVIEMGERCGVPTPVNEKYRRMLLEMQL